MWCHHNETRVLQELGVDDAVVHRAVTDGLQHRPHVRAHHPRVLQLRSRRRAAEGFQRSHSAPDQLVDHPGEEPVRQIVGGLPGLDAHRRQQHRVRGHRRGGKPLRPRHRPRRRVEDVAQARGLALAAVVRDRGRDLAARPPLQHDHRQPGFLFEFRVGEVVLVTEGRWVDLPEHAAARMLGKLLEGLEPQRRDSSGH